MSLILGVDLDGVCANYTQSLRMVVAFEKRVSMDSLTDDVDWNYTKWGIDGREEFLELHRKGVDQGMFLSMNAMPGVSPVLWRLSDAGAHIRVITHRLCFNGSHAQIAGDTIDWLDVQNIPYRDICFMGNKPQAEADIYVEDAPHHIEALWAEGKEVIIFDQPYNKHLTAKGGMRAWDWTDVEEIVLDAIN